MTSQPAAYHSFSDVDDLSLELDREDVLNPIRGILVGIILCAPFWVGVAWALWWRVR